MREVAPKTLAHSLSSGSNQGRFIMQDLLFFDDLIRAQAKAERKKIRKETILRENLNFLIELGYKPIQQKAKYHYKDHNLSFYPSTGKYYDDFTKKSGIITDLPRRDKLREVLVASETE